MAVYEQLLNESRRRLRDSRSFLRIAQLQKYDIDDLIRYSKISEGNVVVAPSVCYGERGVRKEAAINYLAEGGVKLGRKALIAFAIFEDDSIQALPVVAGPGTAANSLHSDIWEDYWDMLWAIDKDFVLTHAPHPDSVAGQVYASKRDEKLVFQLANHFRNDMSPQHIDALKQLSTDLPDSKIYVTEDAFQFHSFDQGRHNAGKMEITTLEERGWK